MKEAKRKKSFLRIFLYAIAVLVVFIAVIAFIAFYKGLVVRTYQITSSKLTNTEPIRVVVLADLHSYPHGGDQQPLIQKVKNAKPDIIMMVGDIADDVAPIRGVVMLMEGIHDIAPCYYVTGNHEIWGNRDEAVRTFREYGVTVLEGEGDSITIKGQLIQILGIDDPEYTPQKGYNEILLPISDFNRDVFTILLSHRPEPINTFSKYGFDLVLSGHTHGGQVRIPFLYNGLYAPNQGWYPPYAGGRYQVLDTVLIVSRGLSYYADLPRIFNPPEVVVVELMAIDGQ